MTRFRAVMSAVASVPQLLLVGLIRLYQLTISPLLGPRCKYYPSCSQYGLEAVRRHGALRGVVLAVWRLLRCNPWSNGGIDDVPPAGSKFFGRSPHQTFPDAAASFSTR